MSLLDIDESKCRRDGICVAVCPPRIIELNDGSPVPTLAANAEERCISCGHCVAACPEGALSRLLMRPEDCPPARPDLALGAEQVEYLLRSRRSVRAYKERHVEHDTLAKLIDIAHYAPTGTNSQNVRWIAIDSRVQVKALAGSVIDLMRDLVRIEHPAAARLGAASLVESWEAGVDIIARGAPALVVAYTPQVDPLLYPVDPIIALSFLDVAAPALGLGTCWAGFFMAAISQWQPLRDALGLPDGKTSLGAMLVGYPRYRYHRLPPRNQPQVDWRE